VLLAEALLVASMLSVALRTHFGGGPATGSLSGNVIGAFAIGVPSLALVAATSRWPIWPLECIFSAPWLLIGAVGDYSEVDGGFVFAIPILLAMLQIGLALVALAFPVLRRRTSDGAAER
jgi:hypothetical protein